MNTPLPYILSWPKLLGVSAQLVLRGHILLVIPLVVYAGLAGLGLIEVEHIVQRALTLPLAQFNVPDHGVVVVRLAARILLWIWLIPVVLAAVLASAKSVWFTGSVSPVVWFNDTMHALMRAIAGGYIVAKKAPFLLIPIALAYVGYVKLQVPNVPYSTSYILFACAGAITIFQCYIAAPLYIATIVAILTRLPLIESLGEAALFRSSERTIVAFHTIAFITLPTVIHLYFHRWTFSPAKLGLFEALIITLVTIYLGCALGVVIFLRMSAAMQVNSAPPVRAK